MKLLLLTLLVLTGIGCAAQTAPSDTVVLDKSGTSKPANLVLLKDGLEIGSIETLSGKTGFRNMKKGIYRVELRSKNRIETVSKLIYVRDGQLLVVRVKLSGPCIYDHPVNYVPRCPESHTDNIIPIVYGLVGQLPNAKAEEVYLGGCLVTECDPQFYCKLHGNKF